ncbi:MAG: hypothetical protein L0I29_07205 [Hyphomicrobiales bacterium]|nr:hypothetical protein [Hyphomicrobiales bacterium]
MRSHSIGRRNDTIDNRAEVSVGKTEAGHGARIKAGIQISGHVRSGRGRAAAELAVHMEEIEEITGQNIVPGSLNVILDRPVRFKESEAAVFDNGFRMLWPAEMGGVAVWIYRWRHTALHVAEVISSQRLRDILHICNNSEVIINIDECHIDQIDWMQSLAWAIVWAGRRDWCYTNDRYYFETLGFCRAMEATQERNAPGAPIVSGPAGRPGQRSVRCERNLTLL